MDETNEVLETEATADEPETDEDLAAFDEDWGDDSNDDDGSNDLLDGDESEEAEESEAEEQTEGEQSEEPAEPEPESGNQRFKINYLGKEEELTLEQMTELAQKGRDYDHVRSERDELKGKTGKQLAFLQKLAEKAGVSVDEQIDLTEAMWLMDEEAEKGNTITEAQALLRVQKNRENAAKTDNEQSNDGEALHPQVARFLAVYPNVKGEDIPQEVWDMSKKLDGDLLTAYLHYENKQLKEENARKAQEAREAKNKSRSTGPLKSAGANRQKDDFDEGWDFNR